MRKFFIVVTLGLMINGCVFANNKPQRSKENPLFKADRQAKAARGKSFSDAEMNAMHIDIDRLRGVISFEQAKAELAQNGCVYKPETRRGYEGEFFIHCKP